MQNFAKRLTKTDRNVLQNFGDFEISVESLYIIVMTLLRSVRMQVDLILILDEF